MEDRVPIYPNPHHQNPAPEWLFVTTHEPTAKSIADITVHSWSRDGICLIPYFVHCWSNTSHDLGFLTHTRHSNIGRIIFDIHIVSRIVSGGYCLHWKGFKGHLLPDHLGSCLPLVQGCSWRRFCAYLSWIYVQNACRFPSAEDPCSETHVKCRHGTVEARGHSELHFKIPSGAPTAWNTLHHDLWLATSCPSLKFWLKSDIAS